MYYTIYKTTNLINGIVYYGKHQTENLNDNYIGSGTEFKQAIKEFGRENFKREILMLFDNEDEMKFAEKLIVTEEFIKRKDNYNLHPGGAGALKGRTAPNKGIPHRSETIAKIKKSNENKVVSKITIQKMKIAQQNRDPSTRFNVGATNKGVPKSKESNEKRSKALKGKRIGSNLEKMKKVLCLELNIIFDCAVDAAKYVGLKFAGDIHDVCKGKRKTAKGYTWIYVE